MLPKEKTKPITDVNRLTVLVYGAPKIGKSTMCSHAEGAVFLATEAGLNSLEVFQVPITSWEEFLAACAELAEGKHSFRTVIIDTLDAAYSLCAAHVLRKNGVTHESELPYGRGYALISNEFTRVLSKLSFLGMGKIYVCHASEIDIESRTGKTTRIVPSIPERIRKTVLATVDVIGYADLDMAPGPDGKPMIRRVMRTKPHPNFEAGDRTGRLPETIDLDWGRFLEAFNRPAAANEASASRTTPAQAEAPGRKPAAASK